MQHEVVWAFGMAPVKLPAHIVRLPTEMQFTIINNNGGFYTPVSSKHYQNDIPLVILREFLTEMH